LSLENSREDDFFSNPNDPFKLLVRPAELFEAMLGAVDTRGPGSALMVPNDEASGAATDVYESLDAGRMEFESAGLKDLNLGDRGDLGTLGDGGALAIRMTGDEAASSGCKNGL
jgi:hypothetical protein